MEIVKTNNKDQLIEAGKIILEGGKPPAIPKAVKHFFFFGFKRRKEFKEIQKEKGKIKSVAIIITPKKSIMRVTCATGKPEDEPFTGEEMEKFLKMLKVDQKKVEDSKSIFVIMDFLTKNISFQQIKKDGKEIKFTL